MTPWGMPGQSKSEFPTLQNELQPEKATATIAAAAGTRKARSTRCSKVPPMFNAGPSSS